MSSALRETRTQLIMEREDVNEVAMDLFGRFDDLFVSLRNKYKSMSLNQINEKISYLITDQCSQFFFLLFNTNNKYPISVYNQCMRNSFFT